MSFGEKLKQARELNNYSLKDIEEETKIRKLYLDALEREDFDILPPRVYATGFVRRYSKFLGLDPDAMVDEFKNLAYSGEPLDEEEEVPKKKRELTTDFRIPYGNILAGIIFLIIAIWAGKMVVGYIGEHADIPDKQPPVPPRVEEPIDKEPIKEPAVTPTPDKIVLKIEAHQDCWLNVIVDGENIFNQTMKAGQEEEFQGKQLIYIKAGNAGGIDITYNGEKIAPIGKLGEVKEKEFKLKS